MHTARHPVIYLVFKGGKILNDGMEEESRLGYTRVMVIDRKRLVDQKI